MYVVLPEDPGSSRTTHVSDCVIKELRVRGQYVQYLVRCSPLRRSPRTTYRAHAAAVSAAQLCPSLGERYEPSHMISTLRGGFSIAKSCYSCAPDNTEDSPKLG